MSYFGTLKLNHLTWQFLELVDVSSIGNDGTSTDQANSDFNFVLPKIVSHWTGSLHESDTFGEKETSVWSSLPSSLSAESILTTDMNGGTQRVHGKIEYTIRVQLFRSSKSIACAVRTIHVYNDANIQPPLWIADFASEYRCRERKPWKRRLRKTGTFISALVTEPAPLQFYCTADSASTTIPICFGFHMPVGKRPDEAQELLPETVEVTFTWRLKTLTFLSVQQLTSMPTFVDARRKPSISTIISVGPQHQLKGTLGCWNESPTLDTEPSRSFWTQNLNLPLIFRKTILPPPPLFTPFIARRYHLPVQMKMVTRRCGNIKLQVEVPLQIVYQRDKSYTGSSGLPPEYDAQTELRTVCSDRTMEVPIYSP